MSLKNFHLIFIIISSLFMMYFGYWSFTNWIYFGDSSYLSYMILSILSFILLIIYYQKFLKKFKGLFN